MKDIEYPVIPDIFLCALFLCALGGDPQALAQAKVLQPQVIAEIGWELADESREQYFRYAIEVTQRLENEDLRTRERAISALDVISLLAKS